MNFCLFTNLPLTIKGDWPTKEDDHKNFESTFPPQLLLLLVFVATRSSCRPAVLATARPETIELSIAFKFTKKILAVDEGGTSDEDQKLFCD